MENRILSNRQILNIFRIVMVARDICRCLVERELKGGMYKWFEDCL